MKKGEMRIARTMLVLSEVVSIWNDREQQIFIAETMVPITALHCNPELFRDRDVIWFVDNESACSTLIRGASKEEDVNGIAECTQFQCLHLNTRIWYEWVDTKANPADKLSRDGLDAEDYGYIAQEALVPDWQSEPDEFRRFDQIRSHCRQIVCDVGAPDGFETARMVIHDS